MFCKSCGKLIDDDSKYCIHCGTNLFSANVPIIENNEKIIEIPDSSKTKIEINSTLKSTNSIYDNHSFKSLYNQENVLEEFEIKTKNSKSSRRIIGVLISFIGCFLLAWDVSFSLLSTHPIAEIYYYIWVSLVFSSILLIIAAFILSKSDKIILNKTISIIVDGLALLLFLYLADFIFIGKDYISGYPPHYVSSSEQSYTSYLLDNHFFDLLHNVFTNKMITWSLFLLIYYSFGELSGGTFGKKIAQLASRNQEKERISLKQCIKKTLIYSTPIWIIFILFVLTNLIGTNPPSMLSNDIVNQINNSAILKFCQWTCFILLFISLFMIFISKGNQSLADIFSGTIVEKKNNRISPSNFTSEKIILNKSSELSEKINANVYNLFNQIEKEKRKLFSGRSLSIVELTEKVFTDKNSFVTINNFYNDYYSIGIIEHLISISSSYGTIYFYIEPFIKLGVCEDTFPYKTLPDSSYKKTTSIKN
ncbi:MAG TPA: zinc-ribbon domain-containing protein [Hanamia sp.]|nr:zinc-ribbon domain-containing protein [Hanamia sp.]